MNEIVAKLREYNRWRRGDEEIAQPDPGEVGKCIDAICDMVDADTKRPKMSALTPETDNLARGNHVVPTEWAEQLERERDMAEDERIDLAKQLRSEQERHAKCQNERDKARFLLEAAQSALDAIHLEVGGWIKIMKAAK